MQLYHILKNDIKATWYEHPAFFFFACYIQHRQFKSVSYRFYNVLVLAGFSSYLRSSFLCLTSQHVTTQFMGFVGSYCTQQGQHRLCELAFIISLIEICCLHTSRRVPAYCFVFMTISAGLPWHQGLWPQGLILSSVLKFQTLAESFQYHSRIPKCCHSPFPGHLALWVRGTSGDL